MLHPNAIDLIGQRFGKLVVVRENGRINNAIAWECRCDCGKTKTIVSSSLRHRTTPVRSCGCLKRFTGRDLTGQRFGRWSVIDRDLSRRGSYWRCVCDCGANRVLVTAALTSGESRSCGCSIREKSASKCPEYACWKAMLYRCENPRNSAYPRYGGRGIKVCERWHVLENFLCDMGSRPSKQHSLDRINPNGNYEPGNCRWATPAEQTSNRALSEPRVREILTRWQAFAALHKDISAEDVVAAIRGDLLGDAEIQFRELAA